MLEGLRLAPEMEYKQRVQEWIKGTYSDVFQYVDPSKDDDTAIRDAFRSYQPVGQQSRMVTLFLALCDHAGLSAERQKEPNVRTRARSISGVARQKPPIREQRKTNGATDLPPALSGLLSSLPLGGQGWTQQDREKFVETFKVVLDFCIPVTEQKEDLPP